MLQVGTSGWCGRQCSWRRRGRWCHCTLQPQHTPARQSTHQSMRPRPNPRAPGAARGQQAALLQLLQQLCAAGYRWRIALSNCLEQSLQWLSREPAGAGGQRWAGSCSSEQLPGWQAPARASRQVGWLARHTCAYPAAPPSPSSGAARSAGGPLRKRSTAQRHVPPTRSGLDGESSAGVCQFRPWITDRSAPTHVCAPAAGRHPRAAPRPAPGATGAW